MPSDNPVPLRPGLPGRMFGGEEGYEALCSFLGIATTKHKLVIVGVPEVKKRLAKNPNVPRHGRKAARLRARLLALYGDPDARREIWKWHHAHHQDKSTRYTVPSLERVALDAYDGDLLTAQPDPSALDDCNAFFNPDIADDDWRGPALAVLPQIRAELEDWPSVAPERQPHVALAAFAVATLLEDARLLEWAAGAHPDLAQEFGRLGVAVAKQEVGTSDCDSTANPSPDNTLADLRESAKALANAAGELADGPATGALFDAVAERSKDLLELRAPILAIVTATNTINELHQDLASLLNEKSQAAPWLAAELEQILTKWQEMYPAATSNAEALRTDIARVNEVIGPALAEVEEAETATLAAQQELQEDSGTPSLAGRQRRLALTELAKEAEERAVLSMTNALAALEPTTHRSERPDDVRDGGPSPKDGTQGAVPDETDTQSTLERPQSRGGTHTPPSPRPQPKPPSDPSLGPDKRQRQDGETGGHDTIEKNDAPPTIPTTNEALDSKHEGLWYAVGTGRVGLAYHIAKLLRATGESATHPTPELLETVALGMAIGEPEGDLANVFAQRVGPLSGLDFEACDPPLRDALNLLLLCASLRPALFSSQQGASIRLLRRVGFSRNLAPVRNLAYAVAVSAEKLLGDRLDVATLMAILGVGLWSDKVDDHRERVKRWRERAVSASFIGPARAVWQYWLSPDGVLGELSRLLTNGTADDASRVRELVAKLGDPKAARDLVEDTHRSLGRKGAHIVGNALAQLQRHLNEPCDLAERWLRIIDDGPGGGRRLEGEVKRLRTDVNRLAPLALNAVTSLQESDPSPGLASALTCAKAAIESLARLFQGEEDLGRPSDSGTRRLALLGDLLFVTDIPVDDAGEIDSSLSPVDALAFLTNSTVHAADLPTAFETRLSRGDLQGTHAVCERMETDNHAATEDARVRLKMAIGERRASLQRRVDELDGWLEQAFIATEMDEGKPAEVTAAIIDVSRRLEEDGGVLTADKSVDDIAREIEPAIVRAVDKVECELDEFLPLQDAHEQALVDDALDTRDVDTLREQLGWLQAGQSIRSPDSSDCAHLSAFLDAATRVEAGSALQDGPKPSQILHAVRNRQDILGLAFSDLAPSQSERSATLLEYWFEMARSRSADPETLGGFFTALGFNLRSVEFRGDAKVILRVEPVRVPAVCPDHTFGSGADGRYDVLLNANRSDARESIVQAVESADSRGNTIMLHLGKLTRTDREGLRRWSIEDAVPFITIDENLILYLASVSGGTLRPLFDCTLPFTCTRPYFTAAGLVPPEAFFGRETERRKIRDRFGSCFVYGGRQLGKTALLHDVRAAFHTPDEGQLAEYVDLKAWDVGIAEGPEHLWHVLWGALNHLGVADDQAPIPRDRNKLGDMVVEAVVRWLDESQDRRLLVLLDEADAFLEADLKDHNPFRVSTKLKSLMDRTERRFKAILCGLHNVLRNTESANHPLAHFGDPICVGPLLENGDLRRARELVRNPLAAVGYTFQSENLITKILRWTNYYPSLIQVFCEALLDHLRRIHGRPLLDPITDEDVGRVFRRPELRYGILGRFSLTLQLDPRYEVVAYAMAFELRGREHNSADGLPRRTIFDLVRMWWEVGFDIREREFDTLLQELCGLGVLRQRRDAAGVAYYAFRNLNVLHLLGDDDRMLEILYKKREAPALFDAPTWHARYQGARPESPKRGPLTYEQESALNKGGRVAVVCGTPAARVEDVEDFLKNRMVKGRVLALDATTDGNALARKVKDLDPKRRDRATVLRFVDDELLWTLRWIEGVTEALRTERGRRTRVVFRADPEKLWDFIEYLPAESLDASPGELFDWVVVGPWHEAFVKQWCSDHGLHETTSKTRELFQLTGGWPLLLERYAECRETTWQARADALNRYIVDYHDEILAQLGLGTSDSRQALGPLLEWNCNPDGNSAPLRADEVDTYAGVWTGPPVDHDILRRRLFWAIQLGLIDDDNGSGTFNPLVARLLSESRE